MKPRISALLGALSFTIPAAAWAQGSGTQSPAEFYGHEMMWGGGGWGWTGMILGPIMMIVVLAIIIAIVVLIVRWLGGSGCPSAHGRKRNAGLDILQERFAKGEIDQQEFEAKRRILDD